MKKFLLFIALLALGTSYCSAQSDNVQPTDPELTITEDQKRLEATVYCVDYLLQPASHNEFAKQFVGLPGFPQNIDGETKETLHIRVDNYFQTHTELIDKVRAERKKAHDKLYGPRPY